MGRCPCLHLWVHWALWRRCWNFHTVSSRVHDWRSIYLTIESVGRNSGKQQVATTQQFHRLRRRSELILGAECAGSRQVREDFDVAPSKVSIRSSLHLGWSRRVICQSRTFAIVLNISLTPKPPRTRCVSLCTHSWWALLELFTSYEDDHSSYKENRPPTSTTHTLPGHQLRRIFIPERIYNPMPTIGSDRGSVVCKVLCPLWSVLPKWRV